MKCRRQLLLFATVLLYSAHLVSQCSNMTGSQPTLSVKLRATQQTVKLGDPVLVSVVLTNISNHDISVWRAPGFEYRVDVRDEKNNLAPDTELGRYRNGHVDFSKVRPQDIDPKYLNGSGACLTLKAGKSLDDQIDVSRRYKLAPGKYSIQVGHEDPTIRKEVRSNAVAVTITQ